ncbi:protein-tyrosine phosphatase [Lactobacillus selangorensis]|uniref:Protein-tyrosine phosphatase n=1 Tax=Lactobacillus selangorensis TaxID=81857 RepID=A0A0R2FWX1_9LACO|nr:tyrosine-protein phosphatase [Lactobacillus selangorensis]KRN29048.1 protein-tyrosine phosphatase [Lactobacillus selangorensis]KRN30039.1 protein-tyrosine phosphatase [Lactobacillus selangorensis]
MSVSAPQRLLNIQGGENFRELGGYRTQDGHTVKWHKLLRSGKLDKLTSADEQLLDQYGVVQDIDFRSPDEVRKSPDKVPVNAVYEHVPVFTYDQTESSVSPEKMRQTLSADSQTGFHQMVDAYHGLVNDAHSKHAYQKFFAALLSNDQPNQVLLFHCTAGKDRTGMGAVFLLSALGVEPAAIRQDYLLTNQVTTKKIASMHQRLEQEHANANLKQSMQDLMTVNPAYLDTALEDIQKQSDTIQRYLHQELELSKDDIAVLRHIYLD